jgi:hypothetical protein
MIADFDSDECPFCGLHIETCECDTSRFVTLMCVYWEINGLLKTLYLDYFRNHEEGTFEYFKSCTLQNLCKSLSLINEKYADHIEGLQKGRNEQRNSPNSEAA